MGLANGDPYQVIQMVKGDHDKVISIFVYSRAFVVNRS